MAHVRYLVLCVSDVPGIDPHVIAEVVRDAIVPASERGLTLAGALAGPRATVMTRDELMKDAAGRAAVAAWEALDDGDHDRESEAIAAEDEVQGVVLRLVADSDVTASSTEAPRPSLILISKGFRDD